MLGKVFFQNEFAGVIDSVPTCLGKRSFPGVAGVIISEIGPFCQALGQMTNPD